MSLRRDLFAETIDRDVGATHSNLGTEKTAYMNIESVAANKSLMQYFTLFLFDMLRDLYIFTLYAHIQLRQACWSNLCLLWIYLSYPFLS